MEAFSFLSPGRSEVSPGAGRDSAVQGAWTRLLWFITISIKQLHRLASSRHNWLKPVALRNLVRYHLKKEYSNSKPNIWDASNQRKLQTPERKKILRWRETFGISAFGFQTPEFIWGKQGGNVYDSPVLKPQSVYYYYYYYYRNL